MGITPIPARIVVKEGFYEIAVDSFSNMGIQVSKSRREHQGSAIGEQEFTNELVEAVVGCIQNLLYAADEGLRGQKVLQSVVD